jgi:hypothetical protein
MVSRSEGGLPARITTPRVVECCFQGTLIPCTLTVLRGEDGIRSMPQHCVQLFEVYARINFPRSLALRR